MDEQPVQLVKETRRPIPATKRHAKRIDYEYERAGTASIFMFTEPLAGWREARARASKTKPEWTVETARLLDGQKCRQSVRRTKSWKFRSFPRLEARGDEERDAQPFTMIRRDSRDHFTAASALFTIGFALIWSLASPLESAEVPPGKPNIVLLYADDMGYGDLGIQNPESKIPTPNLDRLAREGMRFTDAHSSSGICSPSRYALLTGRFHWRKFHDIVNSFDQPAIDEGEFTLPEMLQAEGYRTACIGKWHLGWDWGAIKKSGITSPNPQSGYTPDAFDWSQPIPGGPLAHGFDYYFGDDVPNFPPYTWFENDRVLEAPTEPLAIAAQTAEGAWETRPGPMRKDWDFHAVVPRLTERTVAWIADQRNKKGPFFLYVPFNSPHAPIVPSEKFRGQSQAGGYGDYVVQTDDNVGRILQALEENGFADNTLVIFTSDNGPERYAYERIRNFDHRSAGSLRGLKRDLWEGGHRVPFIVRWTGQVRPGTVTDALVSQVDIMATLAAAAGATLPPDSAHDSYNLLPVWKAGTPSPRRSIVHNTKRGEYAVRHGNWLLVDNQTGGVSQVPGWFDRKYGYAKNVHPGELFDLSQDIGQKRNLYDELPKKVVELKLLLEQIRAKGQVR